MKKWILSTDKRYTSFSDIFTEQFYLQRKVYICWSCSPRCKTYLVLTVCFLIIVIIYLRIVIHIPFIDFTCSKWCICLYCSPWCKKHLVLIVSLLIFGIFVQSYIFLSSFPETVFWEFFKSLYESFIGFQLTVICLAVALTLCSISCREKKKKKQHRIAVS